MSKVIISSVRELDFETPDGTSIKGSQFHLVQEDHSVEKTFVRAEVLKTLGFEEEMVTDLFSPDGEIKLVEASFSSVNGKAKLSKLELLEE